MKLAIVGKGGVGKTTLSASLAMKLARQGRSVVAVDADPDGNLALAVGVAQERMPVLPLLNAVFQVWEPLLRLGGSPGLVLGATATGT